MGKKRRNTAKTGDKAIYKNAAAEVAQKANDSDDDAMYTKVDRFHNQRDEEDMIELNKGQYSDEDEDDKVLDREGVMDLGAGGLSSDEEDDDDETETSSEKEIDQAHAPSRSVMAASSDDSSSDEEDEEEDVRDWGKKKSAYYHGDTADLEIGQEEDDAFVEEEAAKEVQAARMKEMSEDDFVLSSDEDDDDEEGSKDRTVTIKKGTGVKKSTKSDSAKKWTVRDQRKYLNQHSPEFLPVVNHFKDIVKDFNKQTDVVVKALYEVDDENNNAKSVGATPEGEQYLLSRALLQSSAALNLAMYLLLSSDYAEQDGGSKSSDSIMNSHPVLDHLQKLSSLAESMEGKVKSLGLTEQMSNLVKASELLANGQMGEDDEDEEVDQSGEDQSDSATGAKDVPMDASETENSSDSEAENETAPTSTMSKSTKSPKDQSAILMNEARFALRASELDQESATPKKRRRRVAPADFGETLDDQDTNPSTRSLATTINSLEQRFAQKKKKSTTGSDMADQLDDLDGSDDDAVRRGLEMMEAEMGKLSDEEDGPNQDDDSDIDAELDDDNEFYNQIAQKSRSKKKARKEQYSVAPKFPRPEATVVGERSISRTIMKNRGLVAHKNKLNRNPRVKKREQYRKALIRRKGAVRAMRDPQEGIVYGGEETGIKSTIRRSRNLT